MLCTFNCWSLIQRMTGFQYCTTCFTAEEICGVSVLSKATSSSSSLHLVRVNTVSCVSTRILQPKAFSLCHRPAKPQDKSYEAFKLTLSKSINSIHFLYSKPTDGWKSATKTHQQTMICPLQLLARNKSWNLITDKLKHRIQLTVCVVVYLTHNWFQSSLTLACC